MKSRTPFFAPFSLVALGVAVAAGSPSCGGSDVAVPRPDGSSSGAETVNREAGAGGMGGAGGSSGSGGGGAAGQDAAGPPDYFSPDLEPGDRYDPDTVFTDECNPVTQDCPPGRKCDWACPERAYLCKPEPPVPDGGAHGTHGQECGVNKPCAKGHFCSGVQVAGGMFKVLCQKYCGQVDKNPSCPPPMSGGEGFCENRGPTCTVTERFKEPYHLCEI